MPSTVNELALANARIKLLEQTLGELKTRIAFMGWPAEGMWQGQSGSWMPDWRRECMLLEHALHGTPIDHAKLEQFVSTPANQVPKELMVSVQQAWIWAGGNTDIQASVKDLKLALNTLVEICDESSEANSL